MNVHLPGSNHGWPNVEGFCDGDHQTNPSGELAYCSANDLDDPLFVMSPSTAPTGIAAIGADYNYPATYYDDLIYLEYKTGFIKRVRLSGADLREVVSVSVLAEVGGPVAIVPSPDGYLYIMTATGRLYQLVIN